MKQALDLIRPHIDDPHLFAEVMLVLRDRAALAGSEEGLNDLAAGRVVPLGSDLLDELLSTRRRTRAAVSELTQQAEELGLGYDD